ncbi:MAG: DUF3144 domain-containing protein [Deltaproteobacteria bacterium]|nr:DUF3144 domain-containing protein [Deltaproteobacteria bacterium]
MEKNRDEKIYDYADEFINLANKMAETDKSGDVGVALRFAAARYCAYEASLRTGNLAEDREEQVQDFVKVFTEMLRINIEDYIKIQTQEKGI